jgi:hypothetical protein
VFLVSHDEYMVYLLSRNGPLRFFAEMHGMYLKENALTVAEQKTPHHGGG